MSETKVQVLTQESSSSTLNGDQLFLSHIKRLSTLNTFSHMFVWTSTLYKPIPQPQKW